MKGFLQDHHEFTLNSTFWESGGEKLPKNMPTIEVEKKYYSVEKILIFFREMGLPISKSKLYKLTSMDKIPYSKFNNRLIFEKQKLLTWVETQKKDSSKNSKSIDFLSKSASAKLNSKSKK